MLTKESFAKEVAKLFFVATSLLSISAFAWDDSEDEIWLDYAVEHKFEQGWKLKLCRQERWKDGEHTYSHTDLSASYSLDKHWSLGAGLRHIKMDYGTNGWKTDWKEYLNLTGKLKLGGIALSNRVQLSNYDYNPLKDSFLALEDKIVVSPVRKFFAWKLSPYLALEGLHNLEEDFFYRHRQYVGLKMSPVKNLNLHLYLMRQNDLKKHQSWTEKYVMGGALTCSF
jgi:hypothetical protein